MKLLIIRLLIAVQIIVVLSGIANLQKAFAAAPDVEGRMVSSTGVPLWAAWVEWTDKNGNVRHERTQTIFRGKFLFPSWQTGVDRNVLYNTLIDHDFDCNEDDDYTRCSLEIRQANTIEDGFGCGQNPHVFRAIRPIWAESMADFTYTEIKDLPDLNNVPGTYDLGDIVNSQVCTINIIKTVDDLVTGTQTHGTEPVYSGTTVSIGPGTRTPLNPTVTFSTDSPYDFIVNATALSGLYEWSEYSISATNPGGYLMGATICTDFDLGDLTECDHTLPIGMDPVNPEPAIGPSKPNRVVWNWERYVDYYPGNSIETVCPANTLFEIQWHYFEIPFGDPTDLDYDCNNPGNSAVVYWTPNASADYYSLRFDTLSDPYDWDPDGDGVGACPAATDGPGDFCADVHVGDPRLTIDPVSGKWNYQISVNPTSRYTWWMHSRIDGEPNRWGDLVLGPDIRCAPDCNLVVCQSGCLGDSDGDGRIEILQNTTAEFSAYFTSLDGDTNGDGISDLVGSLWIRDPFDSLTDHGNDITTLPGSTNVSWVMNSNGKFADKVDEWLAPSVAVETPFDVYCRSWNDQVAECRPALLVDGPPRYACTGELIEIEVIPFEPTECTLTCGLYDVATNTTPISISWASAHPNLHVWNTSSDVYNGPATSAHTVNSITTGTVISGKTYDPVSGSTSSTCSVACSVPPTPTPTPNMQYHPYCPF